MTLDTKEEYVNGLDFYVRLAGEEMPEFIRKHKQAQVEDEDFRIVDFKDEPLRDYHILNDEIPIDGIVQFYFPDRLGDPGAGPLSFTFPFRNHNKDDVAWSAFPGRPKWDRRPVWKWTNPEEDPKENITLNGSLGIGEDDLVFHCYIREGGVEWL